MTFSRDRLIDIARISAIVACVGLLYSPTVATIGLIGSYTAFAASGQVVFRFRPIFRWPLVYWGIAFLAVVLVGMAYASVSWHERWMDFYKWRTILWCFVMLAIFDDDRWKKRLLGAFIVGTSVAVVASYAVTAGWIVLWRGPTELLRNSSTQSIVFSVSALICIWKALERLENVPVSWAWGMWGIVCALNVAFVMPGRSGYVVLGLGLGVLLMWRVPRMHWITAALAVSLAGAFVFSFSPQMQGRTAEGIEQWTHADESKGHTSLGTRRVFYVNTLEIAKQHWLFGVGTGGFKKAYAEQVAVKYEASDWRAEPTGDPHNQYLSILVQQGVVGLVLFLAWIVSIARSSDGIEKYRPLALAILCGWCVTSLFSSHFKTFVEGHLLMTFIGVLLAGDGTQRRTEGVPREEII